MSIEVSNLSFAYKKNLPVLRDVDFKIESGHFVCLLGPNGAGKSTLFRCMLGLLKNYEGSIKINNEDIRSFSTKQLARRIAYIPQTSLYIFNYKVIDVVLMGTTALTDGFASPGKKELQYASEALERVGIADLKDRMFQQLSGGERQLVLIARALAQQAKTLFMDEPTSNLDYGNQIRVLEQMRQLTKDNCTVVQSTHNPDQAFMYADDILAVMDGSVCACGSRGKVITAELVKKLYGISVSVESLFDGSVHVCVPSSAIGRKTPPFAGAD